MEILAVIPARAGSKGIPRKNIRSLAGRPLITYTIAAARHSRLLTRYVVTTDDAEIAQIAKKHEAEVPFIRPARLASDHTKDLPVFEHCLKWLRVNEGYVPDLVVHLRPTAPLRRPEHIDDAIKKMTSSPDLDSVRSVTAAAQHPLKMWAVHDLLLRPFIPPELFDIVEPYNLPRQELPPAYIQNGAVDVIRTDVILASHSMSGARIGALVMDELDSVNIDSEVDWTVAEAILKRRGKGSSEAWAPQHPSST